MTKITAAPGLNPVHLDDLKKSGLSDATIRNAGLYTAKPSDLPRLCGRRLPPGTSGLVIPYDAAFARVKLFPALVDVDGHAIKYLQPAGSPVRAYIPRAVMPLLDDPAVSLYVTEGEKKALKLTQEKFPTIALGGIWNFRTRGTPADQLIPDLELTAWKGRIVRFVPDSDAWANDQVLCAVYCLGRLLEMRGATVLIVKLPTLEGQEKTGADDFLVAKGSNAFQRLVEKSVTFAHPAFKPFREQEKRAKAEAREQQQQDGADPLVEETIPWDTPVDGAELLTEIEAALTRYVVLPNRHAVTAIALWTVASHGLDSFRVFPMLAIISPVMRCGKTTVLRLLRKMTPRPLPASNISTASVYRTVEACTPTLLLDEADTYTRENPELRGVINSGHTKDTAFVIRVVGEGTKQEPKKFSTWCPKVIAQIGRLLGTWDDRSIVVPMRRKRKVDRVSRLRERMLDRLADLGRQAARWVQDNLQDDVEAETPDVLDDRAVDNWEPLQVVADLVGGSWPERARQAAVALSEGRDAEDDDRGIRLLRDTRTVLTRPAYQHMKRIASSILVDELLEEKESGWATAFKGHPLNQRTLASTLRPFGIKPKTFAADTPRKTTYRGYDRAGFQDAWERYLPPEEASAQKEPKSANESKDLGEKRDLKSEEPILDPKNDVSREKQMDISDVSDKTPENGAGEAEDFGGIPFPEASSSNGSNGREDEDISFPFRANAPSGDQELIDLANELFDGRVV
jgi:hypothetical protein